MIDEVLTVWRMSLTEIRQACTGLSPTEMTRQPAGIRCHGAWTLGHVTFACQAIGDELGIPRWLSDEWTRLFAPGSTALGADAAYPATDALLQALADGERRVTDRLHELGESGLRAPLPDVRWRSRLPTIGHAVIYSLAGHTAAHAGMLAVWRRACESGPGPRGPRG